jgi:hypothetical protein
MKYEPTPTEIAHFQSLVSDVGPGGCRDWLGALTSGYGQFYAGGQRWQAHRYAFGLAHGFAKLRLKLHICHACDRRNCVEPTHLWQGTAMQNAADCTAKGRRARGEAYPNAKLTADAVREMRASGAQPSDAAMIGAFMVKYGVSYTTVIQVITWQTWKHVK